jgi:hypothetical protein
MRNTLTNVEMCTLYLMKCDWTDIVYCWTTTLSINDAVIFPGLIYRVSSAI